MGTGISKKLKHRVFKRDHGLCVYCGCRLAAQADDRTLDHVIPKSKGGSNRMWNLVLCCKPCNRQKGDADPSEDLLELVFKRRDLADLMIMFGKQIEQKKQLGHHEAVPNLIHLQRMIQEVLMGNQDAGSIRLSLDTAENLVQNLKEAA